MGDTLMLALYFPLVVLGMVLVIMWGMSAAGPRRNGYGQDESERLHSHEV